MNTITDKQIKDFQVIYEKRFGKKINRDKAYEKGIRLINLLRIIYKPLNEEEFNQLKKTYEITKKKI